MTEMESGEPITPPGIKIEIDVGIGFLKIKR